MRARLPARSSGSSWSSAARWGRTGLARFDRADELSPGEKVLGADGRVITVSGLRLGTAREALAYGLGVEGIHTYHVGQSGILVRNTSCLGCLAQAEPS